MNLNDLANAGELVAGIATVFTLIFVAFELRANRRQNRLSMLTALDKGWNDINAQVAQDDVLALVFAKGMRDPDSLTEEEATKFFFLAGQYMNHHKSVWTLLTEEGLDTHHERWMRSDISSIYNTPGFLKVFVSLNEWMPPGFVDFVGKQREKQIEFPDWRKI